MVDVLMLGMLVSVVKLASLAQVIPGVALWSVAGLLVVFAALGLSFTPQDVWLWHSERQR
jgi:paraquat-inducible protein A